MITERNLILILSFFFLFHVSGTACAGAKIGKKVRHTAKITFFKNSAGEVMAEIIPVSANGYYSRSGWTQCEIMPDEIRNLYLQKLANQKRVQGYFVVTYIILDKEKFSVTPVFRGELLEIETWQPSFAKSF